MWPLSADKADNDADGQSHEGDLPELTPRQRGKLLEQIVHGFFALSWSRAC